MIIDPEDSDSDTLRSNPDQGRNSLNKLNKLHKLIMAKNAKSVKILRVFGDL